MDDNVAILSFMLEYLFGGYAAASVLVFCFFCGVDAVFKTKILEGMNPLTAGFSLLFLLPKAFFDVYDFSGKAAVYIIWACITASVLWSTHKIGKEKAKAKNKSDGSAP